MVALCLGSGIYGSSLGQHVTQSGFFDDGSESAEASRLGDAHYGRDTSSHIVAIYTAPEGKTVDDPAFRKKVLDNLAKVQEDHPDEILRSIGYFKTPGLLRNMADASKKHAFMSIQLKGDDDDLILKNFKAVQEDLKDPDVNVQLAGLLPLANELTGTIATDQQRAEVLAMPLVVILLFFVFGGVVAAFLPGIIGGLTIAGALGIMRLTALSVPVHYFAQPVVTLIGLGIAIDYGLFIVSRFREEIAEGYDTETAVRRTVVTAGRTIAFSSVLISASVGGLLLFPQGFLKSLTYAMIASVTLAAILSITVLPAILGMLGPNVDALNVRTLLRIPFLRDNEKTNRLINWLGDKLQKTKTSAEVENGFWGRLADRVMKRPVMFAAPILLILIILILPLGGIALGGISEKYLPPTNSVRQAQEEFDRTFPGFRVEPITLVIKSTSGRPVTDAEVAQVRSEARAISGFTEPNDDPSKMWPERPYLDGASKDPSVRVIQNGLENRLDAKAKVDELRAIARPHDLELLVGGTPALEQDSVRTINAKLPAMILIAVSTTTILMFLAFGSLVLPIKAALMNALTLCSTLGVLTWIFVDGHLSSWMNFTPTPLTAPVIGLIIAVIFGLSTDYEVFLVSRMVEARARGMTTEEAIRHGTATTGRLISAAALVLVVVGGAFAFSDLVMMQYLAIGLITALLLDATVVRMFLVPSVMKLLGNDCWWAPRWMKRLQERIGLGEISLEDERKASEPIPEQLDEAMAFGTVLGAPAWQKPVHDPSRPTAAAMEPARSATAVALADPPASDDMTAPLPTTGGGGDDEDATAEEPADVDDSATDGEEPTDEAEPEADETEESEPVDEDEPVDEAVEEEPVDEAEADEEPEAVEEDSGAAEPVDELDEDDDK
ncbi:MMPL family transporter [Mycolicibacterium sp. 120270]|uniref:MMPL family transporter n=1 Tax=Mycolicibacterium sp. 120270 TaxID=3090600 RepID=UPI00299E81CC|nr:MMPL family transporter [Mycolicibacterium sp. 120270]MDX1884862.1 MMPL family transporter [Mycolicibacterium sp. 120270]